MAASTSAVISEILFSINYSRAFQPFPILKQ